jgi:hypothetical protein
MVDKTRKLIEFDEQRGLIFILNKNTPTTKVLRLYTIALRQRLNGQPESNSDSD